MSETSVGARPPSFLPLASVEQPASLRQILGWGLRRRGGRRSVSFFTALLLLAGVTMFAWPAGTDVLGSYKQHHVKDQLASPQFQTLYLEHKIKVGEGLTRLIIDNDRVHVNVMVVQGTTLAALQAGAGHYTTTPLPCDQGNVGIAGHRTTYGRPFNKIDEMHAGDVVTLVTPFAHCIYQVVPPSQIVVPAGVRQPTSNPFVVLPNDYYVVSQQAALGSGHWLTLTSCHPKGSASHRIVLRLKLVKVQPITATSKGST